MVDQADRKIVAMETFCSGTWSTHKSNYKVIGQVSDLVFPQHSLLIHTYMPILNI